MPRGERRERCQREHVQVLDVKGVERHRPDVVIETRSLQHEIGSRLCDCPQCAEEIVEVEHMLDDMTREDEIDVFKTRVFALGSASPGGMGGLRGLSSLRLVLENGLNTLVLPDQFLVPRAADAFDEDGHLKNKESQANFKAVIQKLARAAHVLHG